MNRIAFTIPVEPKSLQFGSIRIGTVGGKARIFPNKQATRTKDTYTKFCAPYRPPTPLTGPVTVSLTYVFERPSRLLPKKYPDGRIWKDTKPDAGNISKSLDDVLTRAGFWVDDAQIAEKHERKFYARRGEKPCIEVEIEPLTAAADRQEGLL